VLNDFELSLNETKTKIHSLPHPINKPWVVELKFLEISSVDKERRQAEDIKHLFEKAFTYTKIFPGESMLAYSISKLNDVLIHPENWTLVENFLLHCILVEPRTVSFALPMMVKFREKGFEISEKSIKDVMNKLIEYHAPVGHGDEVSWGLWGLMEFTQEVVASNAKLLSEPQDSLVALLVLDAKQKGLVPDGLDTSHWFDSLELSDLYNRNWLLAYEGTMQGWLTNPDLINKVNDDPNWGLLKRAECSFYDLSAGTFWTSHDEYL